MDRNGNLFNFYQDVDGSRKITPVGNVADLKKFKVSEIAGVKLDRDVTVVAFQDGSSVELPAGAGAYDKDGKVGGHHGFISYVIEMSCIAALQVLLLYYHASLHFICGIRMSCTATPELCVLECHAWCLGLRLAGLIAISVYCEMLVHCVRFPPEAFRHGHCQCACVCFVLLL